MLSSEGRDTEGSSSGSNFDFRRTRGLSFSVGPSVGSSGGVGPGGGIGLLRPSILSIGALLTAGIEEEEARLCVRDAGRAGAAESRRGNLET